MAPLSNLSSVAQQLPQIYHATCHAEALASMSSLVARLQTEKASGSRSAMPEVQPMSGIQLTLHSTPGPHHTKIFGPDNQLQLQTAV